MTSPSEQGPLDRRWLRVLVTLACLAATLWFGHGRWEQVKLTLGAVPAYGWVASAASVLLGAAVYGLRWRFLHEGFGAVRPVSAVDGAGLALVGAFYGQLFPTQLGADVVQGTLTRGAFERPAAAFLAVGMGRVLGIAGLFVLVGVMGAGAESLGDLPRAALAGGAALLALLCIGALARPPAWLGERMRVLGLPKTPGWRPALNITFLSILTQAAYLSSVWCLLGPTTGAAFRPEVGAAILLAQLAAILPSAFGFGAAQLTLGAFLFRDYGAGIAVMVPAAHWAVTTALLAAVGLIDSFWPFERPR